MQDHGRAEDEAVVKKMMYDLQELDAADEADHGPICPALTVCMAVSRCCNMLQQLAIVAAEGCMEQVGLLAGCALGQAVCMHLCVVWCCRLRDVGQLQLLMCVDL